MSNSTWTVCFFFSCTCSLSRWEADRSSGLNRHQMWPSSCLCPLTAPVNTQRESPLGSTWPLKLKALWIHPGGNLLCKQNCVSWLSNKTEDVSRQEKENQLTSFLSHTSMSHWWKNSILLSRILSLSTFITCRMGSVCVCLSSGSQLKKWYTHR